MSSNRKIGVAGGLVLLAVVAGAAAYWGSQRYLTEVAADAEMRWKKRFAPTTVLVASRDLDAGAVLEPADVARREVPSAYVASGTLAADESAGAVGRRLVQPLRAGDPLTRAVLQSESDASLAARLRAGARAVTVPVDEVSSQAGLVRPGDRVDLLLAEERVEAGERCVVVRALLDSLLVLATGQMQQPGGGPGLPGEPGLSAGREHAYSTITLDVTPEQAQQLAVGLRVGELIPMLRGERDDAPMRLASLGTERLGCRTVVPSPVGVGATPASTVRTGAGSALELMVGGREPIERVRHWFPEG